MDSSFARRTRWDLTTNRYTQALEAYRASGRELLDLTASNPTTVGLRYSERPLLAALSDPRALTYSPEPEGMLSAREAVAGYYAERGAKVSPDDILLTTSTSEAYSFVFRLLCDPGDAVLVPTPSYPLFDFLADIQDVRLFPYELVYDHGWQVEFNSLRDATARARATGARPRAVLAVHPNNPTGSYVDARDMRLLNELCAAEDAAIVADEVFLDYALVDRAPLTFAANEDALTFTLSGLSKISALPQMKAAWIAVSGPPPRKSAALARLEMIADTYLSMSAPIQLALPAMLDERRNIQPQLMERVRENLAVLDAQLARQQVCSRLSVDGGWYAVLRVPATASDEDVAIRLLETSGVLLQPGHFYDFPSGCYLVVSLITESAVFREGISRMLRVLS
jgi:aspartate/methionine/tyrosine aminotransferase